MATEEVISINSVAPKSEPIPDDYTSPSTSSLGEGEGEPPSASTDAAIDPPPPPKRKGGRKPIYATSEERKQRNRQAQAAFRERRTEYIKQLETTIQHHEETLQNLQQSHRTAADECLMLRYKNSLLERILLEKGIDVQAELRLKGSPHLRPTRQGTTNHVSPMQKAILNRQQQARQRPVAASPAQAGNQANSTSTMSTFGGSPAVQSTPPSQQQSPTTTRSPGFPMPNTVASQTNGVDLQPPQQRQQGQQQPRPTSHMRFGQDLRSQMRHNNMTDSRSFGQPTQQPLSHQPTQQSFFPSSFQKHYDQLDQEYDALGNGLDDMDAEDIDVDSFIPNFRLPPTAGHLSMGSQPTSLTSTSVVNDMTGPSALPYEYDPMLDADPFGLSASMHFPNPYAFPPSQSRR